MPIIYFDHKKIKKINPKMGDSENFYHKIHKILRNVKGVNKSNNYNIVKRNKK